MTEAQAKEQTGQAKIQDKLEVSWKADQRSCWVAHQVVKAPAELTQVQVKPTEEQSKQRLDLGESAKATEQATWEAAAWGSQGAGSHTTALSP